MSREIVDDVINKYLESLYYKATLRYYSYLNYGHFNLICDNPYKDKVYIDDFSIPEWMLHFFTNKKQFTAGSSLLSHEMYVFYESIPFVLDQEFRRIGGPLLPGESKEWLYRHRIWSNFDSGIQMDEAAWFEATPEQVALHVGEQMACSGVIIDGCCGVGASLINFSYFCDLAVGVDLDASRISKVRHNAKVCEVENVKAIEASLFDFRDCVVKNGGYSSTSTTITDTTGLVKKDLSSELCDEEEWGFALEDVGGVFVSPPWGGRQYRLADWFSLTDVAVPNMVDVFAASCDLCPRGVVVMHYPRSVSMAEIVMLGMTRGYRVIEVERVVIADGLLAKNKWRLSMSREHNATLVYYSHTLESSIMRRFCGGSVVVQMDQLPLNFNESISNGQTASQRRSEAALKSRIEENRLRAKRKASDKKNGADLDEDEDDLQEGGGVFGYDYEEASPVHVVNDQNSAIDNALKKSLIFCPSISNNSIPAATPLQNAVSPSQKNLNKDFTFNHTSAPFVPSLCSPPPDLPSNHLATPSPSTFSIGKYDPPVSPMPTSAFREFQPSAMPFFPSASMQHSSSVYLSPDSPTTFVPPEGFPFYSSENNVSRTQNKNDPSPCEVHQKSSSISIADGITSFKTDCENKDNPPKPTAPLTESKSPINALPFEPSSAKTLSFQPFIPSSDIANNPFANPFASIINFSPSAAPFIPSSLGLPASVPRYSLTVADLPLSEDDPWDFAGPVEELKAYSRAQNPLLPPMGKNKIPDPACGLIERSLFYTYAITNPLVFDVCRRSFAFLLSSAILGYLHILPSKHNNGPLIETMASDEYLMALNDWVRSLESKIEIERKRTQSIRDEYNEQQRLFTNNSALCNTNAGSHCAQPLPVVPQIPRHLEKSTIKVPFPPKSPPAPTQVLYSSLTTPLLSAGQRCLEVVFRMLTSNHNFTGDLDKKKHTTATILLQAVKTVSNAQTTLSHSTHFAKSVPTPSDKKLTPTVEFLSILQNLVPPSVYKLLCIPICEKLSTSNINNPALSSLQTTTSMNDSQEMTKIDTTHCVESTILPSNTHTIRSALMPLAVSTFSLGTAAKFVSDRVVQDVCVEATWGKWWNKRVSLSNPSIANVSKKIQIKINTAQSVASRKGESDGEEGANEEDQQDNIQVDEERKAQENQDADFIEIDIRTSEEIEERRKIYQKIKKKRKALKIRLEKEEKEAEEKAKREAEAEKLRQERAKRVGGRNGGRNSAESGNDNRRFKR